VGSLSRAERRTVALAEAITSTAAVLLVEEPLALVDARATSRIAPQLVRRARDGACVVVATASMRDARDVSGHLLVFERGALLGRISARDPVLFTGAQGVTVRALTSSAASLAAEVARDPALQVTHEGDLVVVRGSDLVALAATIQRAAAAVDAPLDALQPVLLDPTELRAAIAREHPRPPSLPPPSMVSS
jgi:energy-coupling factor transporter ATP-binding protein EcfA2